MFAINKRTALRITGTSDTVLVTAFVDHESFEIKDGRLYYEHSGDSEVWWDRVRH